MTRTNPNTDRLQELHTQLEAALHKIDDLENCSRRYNFRIRGIPETVTNISETVQNLIKDIIPDIPQYKLELDHAHRALQPPRKDGLPRDIIVNPHYYGIKEEVMKRARSLNQISFQGKTIKIFTDLAPATIQKRSAIKPLLNVLSYKGC